MRLAVFGMKVLQLIIDYWLLFIGGIPMNRDGGFILKV
jgi:hypothetical protein